MSVPYASAKSGAAARQEITKMLAKFGCESVGFMDNFADGSVILAFKHRGRPVQLEASGKGWAALYLREHPWTFRRRGIRANYEKAALEQGQIAVNSILRDWVKGQLTAVECGMMPFEAVFAVHMLLPDGTRVIDHIDKTLRLAPPAA